MQKQISSLPPNQAGFSHHLLLPILAVLVVGFIGFTMASGGSALTLKDRGPSSACVNRSFGIAKDGAKINDKSICNKYIRSIVSAGASAKYKLGSSIYFDARASKTVLRWQKNWEIKQDGVIDARKDWKYLCSDANTFKLKTEYEKAGCRYL